MIKIRNPVPSCCRGTHCPHKKFGLDETCTSVADEHEMLARYVDEAKKLYFADRGEEASPEAYYRKIADQAAQELAGFIDAQIDKEWAARVQPLTSRRGLRLVRPSSS